MESIKPFTQGSTVGISYLVAFRVLLLTIALLFAAVCTLVYGGELAQRASALYFPISLVYGATALSAFWLKSESPRPWFSALQLAFDIVVITGLVYATGGSISPFLFLYLPLVMVSSVLFSRTTGLLVAAGAGLSYVGMALAMRTGVLLSIEGTPVPISPSGGLMVQVVGLCSAMILVGVASSFLAVRVRSSDSLLAQSRKDLDDANASRRILADSVTDGVITIDLNKNVTSINHAATGLFRITEEQALGQNLMQVLEGRCAVEGSVEPLVLNSDLAQEAVIMHADGDIPVNVVVRQEPLSDETGAHCGTMLILQDVTKLRSIEEQLEMQEHMARLLAQRDAETTTPKHLGGFIGESPVMQKVFRLIERVAQSDATVLVHGESGTGKELVAKAIHAASTRLNGPFIPVNCGAIPENLIESELFGHKKGSFTGADSDHTGLFRQADRGTIFLDEIGELPLHMQTKLLRVIQDKRVRPVGGDKDFAIDVRIIAATNKNLKSEIQLSKFREDLYYRLNVISIALPPLRERRSDIPLLTTAILSRLVDKDRSPMIPAATMQLLMNYDYPGNVRELENILERAHVLGGEIILPEHLPESVRAGKRSSFSSQGETLIIVDENIQLPVNLDEVLASLERKYLELALLKTNGAKKRAADLLGMNFRSFRYRLQKFGLSNDGEEAQ